MQIVYFPFINMNNRQEIDFVFLKIWNFNLMKGEHESLEWRGLADLTLG